jgi:cellulose biosynthesis protein BcsQ
LRFAAFTVSFLVRTALSRLIQDDKITSPLSDFIKNQKIPDGFGSDKRTLYEQVISNDTVAKTAYAFFIKKNLWLVAGDRLTNQLDSEITTQEILTDEKFKLMVQPNNKTGKPYHSIRATAKKYQAEFVLLDMNPSSGVLNRCLLTSSDYLIMSTISDFHSAETMNMMKENLDSWVKKMNAIKDTQAMEGRKSFFPIRDIKIKFMGYIINRIDVNQIGPIVNGLEQNGRYRKVEECWMNRIQKGADKLTKLRSMIRFINRKMT